MAQAVDDDTYTDPGGSLQRGPAGSLVEQPPFDAYGRRRSSRSSPTGPGSRGGNWEDPTYRAGYHAGWRASNPGYREREVERRAQAKRIKKMEAERKADLLTQLRPVERDATIDVWFSAWLRARMIEESVTYRELAEATGMAESTGHRISRRGRLGTFLSVASTYAAAFGYHFELVRNSE